jgi:signal transduction histidine kinase
LVYAEADVPDLFEENKKMSVLNQEVNNLQRQLIKEKKNLQATLTELKETQQMLVHAEKMNALGKLVAGVAHEINNPIAFVYSNVFSLEKYIGELVQSYVELEGLVEARTDQEINRMAKDIREKYDLDFLVDDISDMTIQSKTGLERVKTIIEDLRKFSRLDEAEMKEIDLIDNLSSTVGIAGLEFSKRNIRLKLDTPEKLMVECFPGQLNQALLNVIVNAAQAIEADGNITISVNEDLAVVQIKITDDGCGIPETIRSKIFDPFFTSKPIGTGTGLGLSITYKIITELHQGRIEVDSTVGKGSTFILSIPNKQKN